MRCRLSVGTGIRDHYLIHYVISGKRHIRSQQRNPFSFSAEDAFLVYPNTEIIYRADAKTPWEYAWVVFTGSDAATILQATDFFPANIHVFMQFPTAKKSNVSFCISMMPEETDLNMPLK